MLGVVLSAGVGVGAMLSVAIGVGAMPGVVLSVAMGRGRDAGQGAVLSVGTVSGGYSGRP
ncbi:hypothetical protein N5079_27340 [Planotetraspora sp. A-T 1434]|uniref:hypothetical protein n=1 Tax=Planotetraspora sp. A-T 1434 TaxID=2979219 RepID=UPI0021BEFB18|nr:hypothetical protein [Planotetraspora sp. A-T 1434]MCT9933931.1 hypothetical protein [Planotetraspora sp. A-T 1434]